MHCKTKKTKSKIYIIIFLFIFLTFIISSRLFHLQIYLSDTFFHRSQKNFLRIEKTIPTRGNILDINGKLLATNRPIHDLYWQGNGNGKLNNQKLKTIKILEKILDKNIRSDKKIMTDIKKADIYQKKILILSDINFEQLSKIEEQLPYDSTILISSSFKRFYPHNSCACHTLGYLGRLHIEGIGKMGLEKIFESTLHGRSGSIIKTINSYGKKLSETPLEKALSGDDIKTTLNIDLQKIVERIFPINERGTCILMDPYTGAILSLISRPSFDPNTFLEPISLTSWESLQEGNAFLNRAFDACYPPGSIFKLVTASAALENQIIDLEKKWICNGYFYLGGRKYLCHQLDGHGEMTVDKALEQSCNTFFYHIGAKIDIDVIADYAKRFGLGKKTNITFPEKTGIVPTRKWKLKNRGSDWWQGETLSVAIGQSLLTVTPIQIACMISSIFTGYLPTPRILTNEPIIKRKLNIQQDTLTFLKESMQKVATQGTGKNISKIKNIEIYAKTGTAQTSALKKRKLGKIYREHRWFVTYFKYKENLPLTLIVLVEHPKSKLSAKNVAKKFLYEYKSLIDQQDKDTISDSYTEFCTIR